MRVIVLAVLLGCLAMLCWADVGPGDEAQYYLASSSENQTPPVARVRVVAGPSERVSGKACRWWEMTLEKPDGRAIGIRVLSERVPMTSDSGPGKVFRYIYSPAPGECFEYVDATTGAALLPELDSFERDYFPHSYEEARYTQGFANTGRLIGHVLVRTNVRPNFPKADFSNPKVLKLRSDLLIGAEIDARDDRDESVPKDKREHTPLTRDEYVEMISAGANYFHSGKETAHWLLEQPVFVMHRGTHPDDVYRSNCVIHEMFIDEPATRFGWSQGLPSTIASPDVAANAIAMRVEESEHRKHRGFQLQNWFHTGTMEALHGKSPSWETQQYTAWYQLAGGAPGLIFEGRYVKRGYGWSPELVLGEGLEGLDDKQQYDYFHAFLRGAARRWNGYWGTSVYPEGDRSMMVPALCHAYDRGARCLWFWACDNLPYKWRIEVLKGLKKHIDAHPRQPSLSLGRNLKSISNKPAFTSGLTADTAIVLPKGYMLTVDSSWHMQPEALNDSGASYRDICAAATFQGILLSRAGIEYDYVNDYPGLKKAGYKQLIYVREDGRVEWVPKRGSVNAPTDLKLGFAPGKPPVSAESLPEADYTVPRAGKVTIDGDLSDWCSAQWTTMEGSPYHFGDNYNLELDLQIPEDVTPKSDQQCLGFTWDQISPEYRRKYLLEGYVESEVVVTSITPGGAAEKAGLREGDVIHHWNEKWIRWAFEVWGKVYESKCKPGSVAHLKITRNGLDRLGGPKDLSARLAFALDDANIYFACDVTDDVHQQIMPGCDFWQNDCVQVGFDPVLSRGHGYGEQGHEIGFALQDGRPVVWRYAGRRGQPLGEMKSVKCAAKRVGDRTTYEAAIPIAELEPMAPDMWRRVGMCVTVNDSDDGRSRKARVELVTGAMTQGKKLVEFPVYEFAPSPDASKLSAAITWNRRCMKPGGQVELTVTVSSPTTRTAKVRSTLTSLDDPGTKPIVAETTMPVMAEATAYTLWARTSSPPGRYRLEVAVVAPDGSVSARDALPIFVYK
jgi:hypothetical protein